MSDDVSGMYMVDVFVTFLKYISFFGLFHTDLYLAGLDHSEKDDVMVTHQIFNFFKLLTASKKNSMSKRRKKNHETIKLILLFLYFLFHRRGLFTLKKRLFIYLFFFQILLCHVCLKIFRVLYFLFYILRKFFSFWKVKFFEEAKKVILEESYGPKRL